MPDAMKGLLRDEKSLLAAALLLVLAWPLLPALLGAGQVATMAAALVLIAATLLVAQRAAHHAEALAQRFGEPYGTMLLTLSAVAVEVIILGIMLMHLDSRTLVRDTIYAALMLDINGILGLAAILGGLRHGEQPYNVDSGNTYIVMILTAVGVSMVVPEFVPRTAGRAYSVFNILAMSLLYTLFLRLQTGQHSYFFSYAYGPRHPRAQNGAAPRARLRRPLVLLLAGVALIALLSEVLAKLLDAGLAGSGLPPFVVALFVAVISASPEILTALRAALHNRMQSTVNIALGASLSTVILTIPLIELLALATGKPIAMGLSPMQTAMVLITLLTASINLNDGETNAIEGLTHFVLFATFLMLAALDV